MTPTLQTRLAASVTAAALSLMLLAGIADYAIPQAPTALQFAAATTGLVG